SYAPIGYDDLVRAGLLHIVHGKRGRDPGPSYDLTAKGRDFASKFSRGSLTQRRAYVIDIPVGEFRYVAGSAVLEASENRRFPYSFATAQHGSCGYPARISARTHKSLEFAGCV